MLDNSAERDVVDLDDDEDEVSIVAEEKQEEGALKRKKEESWNWVLMDQQEEQEVASSSSKEVIFVEDDADAPPPKKSPKFLCFLCDIVFDNLHGLRLHENECHAAKMLECRECGELFSTADQLYFHSLTHRPRTSGATRTIVRKFTLQPGIPKPTLQAHLLAPLSRKAYPCEHCSFVGTTKALLAEHKEVCCIFKCFECKDQAFPHEWMLLEHYKTHQPDKCVKCQQRHYDPCVCLRCYAPFECRQEYHLHEKICTGALPWKCRVCQAPFEEQTVLLVHLKSGTHTRIELEEALLWDTYPFFKRATPEKCDICDKEFQGQRGLKVHISRTHKEVHLVGARPEEEEDSDGDF